jgi:hypothetical protein
VDTVANPIIQIPLRPIGQLIAAVLLSIPTWLVGHLMAFGLAHLGDAVGPHPTNNFFYAAGDGLMASVCLALFLLRFNASKSARVWCWLAVFVLCVGAMPAWGVLLGGEIMHFVVAWILLATAFMMWCAWLPWWRPQCLSPNQPLQLTSDARES